MSLLNISEKTSLALHSLVLLAKKKNHRMTVSKLAEEQNVSHSHLAKVFQGLKVAGLVDSVRGPAGGFRLSREAENISFWEIYETIEGRVQFMDCPLGKKNCTFGRCIFGTEFKSLSENICKSFKKIRLADF